MHLACVFVVFTSSVVIFAKHQVFSLLFLIFSFNISSVILILLELELLGLLFITIYAGAVSILFLFSFMLLESNLQNLSENKLVYIPLGFLFGFLIFIPLMYNTCGFFSRSDILQEPLDLKLSFVNSFVAIFVKMYNNDFQNFDNCNLLRIAESNYTLFKDYLPSFKAYGELLYSLFYIQLLILGLVLLLVLLGSVRLTNNYSNCNIQKFDQILIKQMARTFVH
jgi:NADH:ubiquinone oxidoreductase subunit 6 (subunit J)